MSLEQRGKKTGRNGCLKVQEMQREKHNHGVLRMILRRLTKLTSASFGYRRDGQNHPDS